MTILIRFISNKGIEGNTKQYSISTMVDKQTAQEIVNRDHSMFIEGGGSIEIIGKIVQL
jgi:hypothetical protein